MSSVCMGEIGWIWYLGAFEDVLTCLRDSKLGHMGSSCRYCGLSASKHDALCKSCVGRVDGYTV